MSAQIITALRKRADAMTAMAEKIPPAGDGTRHVLLVLAAEFRALADEAEGK